MQILRPDSITPIERYLERRRRLPDVAEAQIEFATVLLYREREYRAMYSSRWMMGDAPRRSDDSPFAPFDLTEAAAGILAAAAAGELHGAAQVEDLFGLKDEAIDGLARTLRPIQTHGLGALIHARLLIDMCRFDEAMAAAERGLGLGQPRQALALIYHAALLGAVDGTIPTGESIARDAAARARRLTPPPAFDRQWDRRALDALDERIRQHGLRIRKRVEGQAFSRFIVTERAFCESARAAALAAFRDDHVPAGLQHLIPLAREIGVGDDPCRALFLRRMSVRERREAAAAIRASADAIDGWLTSRGPAPPEGEAAAFFWLLAAAEEIR